MKLFAKMIQKKITKKTIGILTRMINKTNGNGLQTQILKKVKINNKLNSSYNNKKTNKSKEIKICWICFQMTRMFNNKQHVNIY